jgi:hypothetical protein
MACVSAKPQNTGIKVTAGIKMDTLSVIIIGVIVVLIFDVYFIVHIRKKRQGMFKLVIEKGLVVEHQGNVPSEFLYDIQQLARIYKPDSLILNGSGINTSSPELKILGQLNEELKSKIERSLKLSLQ